MQRTFYPKHINYFGNGSGRDQQVLINNGGLIKPDKKNLGYHGVHISRYNSIVAERRSPSPSKEASTHYYMSDGTGRDSYVLENNGGSRPEYNKHFRSPENIFASSLRSGRKSPLKYFKNHNDIADITTYLNWKSKLGYETNFKNSKIQSNLTQRLATGSPTRIKIIKQIGNNRIIESPKYSPQSSYDATNDKLLSIMAKKQQMKSSFKNVELKHMKIKRTLEPLNTSAFLNSTIVHDPASLKHSSQAALNGQDSLDKHRFQKNVQTSYQKNRTTNQSKM